MSFLITDFLCVPHLSGNLIFQDNIQSQLLSFISSPNTRLLVTRLLVITIENQNFQNITFILLHFNIGSSGFPCHVTLLYC